MPRDLESERATIDSMPPLTKEPEGGAPPALFFQPNEPDRHESRLDSLHPFVQTLNVTDLESCTNLENAAFPPNEAASRDKFFYRLTVCGELCLGLFTSMTPNTTSDGSAPTSGVERKSRLLAHAISTKSTNDKITDDDMALPPKWKTDLHADPHLGHKEEGRTICLHSLAVLPEYQKTGLGSLLMKSYLQHMQNAGVTDRVAILAHKELLPFYEKLGFVNRGKSSATYGGGGWYDMVYEFKGSPSFPPNQG